MEQPHGSRRARTLGRRGFMLGGVALTGLGLTSMTGNEPAMATPVSGTRSLLMHDPRRRTSLNVTYWTDGWYNPDAMAQINYFMRDRRNDQVIEIDPQLVDILHRVQQAAGGLSPIHLISGYRSPATNAYLAARSRGVARNSYHIYGRAADISIPGVSLRGLRNIALSLEAGGVGYYPRSDFVHVDNGPIRNW